MNTSFLSWFDTPSADLTEELSSLNLPDIKPPRNPRLVPPKACWLFVYPCGTPIDFCFSEEVSPMRRDYWTQFIQALGGRVVPTNAPLDCICIIVPDSRLWVPSTKTLSYISQEKYTASVIFEDWLELCCQRNYILPPIYHRIHIVAEYMRIAVCNTRYLQCLHTTAMIPLEDGIPESSDTGNLSVQGFKMDTTKLLGHIPTVSIHKFSAERVDACISTFVAAVTSMGSLWQDFSTSEWNHFLSAESNLLGGSQDVDAKLRGYWPSHPLLLYNLRGFRRMHCPGNSIEERRRIWISHRHDINIRRGRDLGSMHTLLTKDTINTIIDGDGSHLDVLPMATIDQEMTDPEIATAPITRAEVEPDGEDLAAATHDADIDAENAAQLAIREASTQLDDEIRDDINLGDDVLPTEVIYADVSIDAYVTRYEALLAAPENTQERRQTIAASILSGYTDATRRTQDRLIVENDRELRLSDFVASVDVDSVWATFQADDPFPFGMEEEFQIYPVGPFHMRQVGTSKFRVDPSERGNNNNWSARVPIHHFANTPFITIGAKTTVQAIFPRLRDTVSGRKIAAIPNKYCRVFYDEIVRPAAIEVFGDAAVTHHWPLDYANYILKDRGPDGRLVFARTALETNRSNQTDHPVQRFLQAMDRITVASNDADVKMLRGMRFLIQRQNEKLQYRFDDVWGERGPGDPGHGHSPGRRLSDAIDDVLRRAIEVPWVNIPQDTHVDLAMELACKDNNWEPYLSRDAHPAALVHYMGLNPTDALYETRLNRRSEHERYKLHRMAGVAAIAGFHYNSQTRQDIVGRDVRALKMYHTQKEYVYSKRAKYGHRQPANSAYLSQNQSYTDYRTGLCKTLAKSVTEGQNAIRIEVTIPFDTAGGFHLHPGREILDGIVLLRRGTLSKYQALKVEAISIIHATMVNQGRFEAERQNIRVLTLLALFGWFTKLLFSRANPLDSRDAPYFDALCGYLTHRVDPYASGQTVFSMTNLWPAGERCPAVSDTVAFSMAALLRHFSLPNEQVLMNLVAARDRAYKQGGTGRSKQMAPGLDWLLRGRNGPWLHTTRKLEEEGIPILFSDSIGCLKDLTADQVVESIFLGLGRAFWERLPYRQMPEGEEKPNLASIHDADGVKTTWGVEKFRVESVRTIRQYFAVCESAIEAEKATRQPAQKWLETFEKLFGSWEERWVPVPKKHFVTKMGYYSHWKSALESQPPVFQYSMYRLMRAKFDTLHAFPGVDANKGWQRIRLSNAIRLVVNPQVKELTGEAGYTIQG